ncbi:Ankyrin_repeat protein 2 [Hexamita inflata]|uniref:Ankyrin repeat protein 2 n=1 Tax=Hexamita inflata TaxID=28002 RepID=A0AA86REK3_9EUKA|nr:Ankyrin repeat protein 2 [Hexamita inflata]
MQTVEQWFNCIQKGNIMLVHEGLEAFSGSQDKRGHSGMMIACQFGHLNIVQLLAPYEIQLLNNKQQDALNIAKEFKQMQIVDYLQQVQIPGSAAYIRTHYNNWVTAICNGDMQIVQQQFQYFNGVRDYRSQFAGYTSLMHASASNQVRMVQIFIQEAQIITKRGKTALMIAAENQSVDAIQLLAPLEIGLQDDFGWNALMYAVDSKCIPGIQILMQSVELRVRNVFGLGPIEIARQQGRKDIENMLMQIQ